MPAVRPLTDTTLRATFTDSALPAGHHQRLRELGVDVANAAVVSHSPGPRPLVSVAVVPFTATAITANSHGSVHGGNVAWLVDTVTSMHLAALIGSRRHVSIGLNVTYLKPVPVGLRCVIESRVVRVGRTAAFLEADIRMAAAGSHREHTCATGQHTKMLLESAPTTTTAATKSTNSNNVARSKL